MTNILSIVILYAFALFESFLLIVLIGLLYKIKTKSVLVHFLSRILVYFYCLFSLITVVATDRFMGLSGDEVVQSIICIFIYMAALLYAIAKNDPHAHDKVEFKLKKRK